MTSLGGVVCDSDGQKQRHGACSRLGWDAEQNRAVLHRGSTLLLCHSLKESADASPCDSGWRGHRR